MLRDITSANKSSINTKEESPPLGGSNVSGTVVQRVGIGNRKSGIAVIFQVKRGTQMLFWFR